MGSINQVGQRTQTGHLRQLPVHSVSFPKHFCLIAANFPKHFWCISSMSSKFNVYFQHHCNFDILNFYKILPLFHITYPLYMNHKLHAYIEYYTHYF